MGDSAKKLEMPDAHYLSSALGWLELGDEKSAIEELARIAPEFQRHPHVLQVQLAISIKTALGWLEMGDAQSAVDEVKRIAPQFQKHPQVLRVQLAISTKTARWDVAAEVANALRLAEPKDVNWWVSLAYATRRSPGGGLEAAKLILLDAQKKFPKEPIVPYNIACYCCQLGALERARGYLEKSFKLGNAKELKSMAATDPDLERLWPELGKKGGF